MNQEMDDRKQIVIVNQDAGYLMIDIANAYVSKGYQVTLMAGRVVPRKTALSQFVKLEKIIVYNKSTTFRRIATWLIAAIQIYFKIIFRYPKSQLLIVSNPPVAPLLPLFMRNKFSLLIYDTYPDALVDMGVLKRNSLIIRCWEKLNFRVFKKAEKVFTITEGMKELLSKYVHNSKLEVIPLWADTELLKPVSREENHFLIQHGLQNKFVVLYSGNIAKSGDADIMVKLARMTKDDEIVYLIIGEGVNKPFLESEIQKHHLANCMLLPWQNTDMLPCSLSAASVSVVGLGKDVSRVAMPSKFFSYLAVGSPVISIAESESDLAKIVETNNVGRNFEDANIDEVLQFIITLKKDTVLQDEFRKNSLQTSHLFSSDNAYKFIR